MIVRLIIKLSIIVSAAVLMTLLTGCSDDPLATIDFGAVSGTVRHAGTGSPLDAVIVTTTPATSSVTTGEDGVYRLESLEPGSYAVRCRRDGFRDALVNVVVYEGETTTADVLMTTAETENNPPSEPSVPVPANGAVLDGTNTVLSWSASDIDKDDALTFDVYFGEAGETPVPLFVSAWEDTSIVVDGLMYDRTYVWQVVARDSFGATVNGRVWSFSTAAFPMNPIVFASMREGQYEIYSIAPDGTGLARLTDNPNRDWWPRVNLADGSISFVSLRDIHPYIYTMSFDGSNVVRITDVSIEGYYNDGRGFAWSDDGRSIYYPHYETLYRMNADGTGLTELASAPPGMQFRECDVSDAEGLIAVVVQGSEQYENSIYVMDMDGSGMRELIGDRPGQLCHPSLSPDGRTLLFCQDFSGYEDVSGRMLDSHIIAVSTVSEDGMEIDLSMTKPTGTNDLEPVWSPNGGEILFVNTSSDEYSPSDLYIMDIDGGNRMLFVEDGMMPDWK